MFRIGAKIFLLGF